MLLGALVKERGVPRRGFGAGLRRGRGASRGAEAQGLVRLPLGNRDGEVVGSGETEPFAEEADVLAPVAAAADAEAEGADRGPGERGRPIYF